MIQYKIEDKRIIFFSGEETLDMWQIKKDIPEEIRNEITEIDFSPCEETKHIKDSLQWSFKNIIKVTLPLNLISLGSDFFQSLEKLEEVDLTTNIKRLESRTFCNCKKLKKIIFPQGLEYIGESCFYWCEELETVELPSSLEIIEDNAFMGCENLRVFIMKDKLKKIGSDVFNGTRIKNLDLPSSLEEIGDMKDIDFIDMSKCNKIKNLKCNFSRFKCLVLPNGLESIISNIDGSRTNNDKIVFFPPELKNIELELQGKFIALFLFSPVKNFRKIENKGGQEIWIYVDKNDIAYYEKMLELEGVSDKFHFESRGQLEYFWD